MAKSFFERLTGSVRTADDAVESERLNKTVLPSSQARKKADGGEEESKVIHPVAAEGGQAAVPAEGEAEEGQLTVDIYDDGVYMVIQSTVAGVKPEDIDISLQDDTLVIRGSRRRAQEVKDDSFYYRELYWGAFSRSIILPEEVDFQKAEASIKNGLLTVRLPKKDRGEKKIRVKVE